jgi:hypothetical protein
MSKKLVLHVRNIRDYLQGEELLTNTEMTYEDVILKELGAYE